jgi:hypothetical protein
MAEKDGRRMISISGVISTLIWIIFIVAYIISALRDAKANRDCRKEVVKMNTLLLEQNEELIKANENLKTVIVRVCSKSVRDRKESEKEKENA